jgi:hypothetical protein
LKARADADRLDRGHALDFRVANRVGDLALIRPQMNRAGQRAEPSSSFMLPSIQSDEVMRGSGISDESALVRTLARVRLFGYGLTR